jgi:hypothetical protein
VIGKEKVYYATTRGTAYSMAKRAYLLKEQYRHEKNVYRSEGVLQRCHIAACDRG